MTTVLEPRPIRTLPPLVASQIAAGEVVERPASVIKELVENSLDAGATRITVEIEQGGIELIRITDDGGGIPAAELPLALAPHATSKISSVTDLDSIATLGFRGEALASIAAVSRLSIRSRTSADPGASQLDAEGERLAPVRPAAGAIGTCITVRNLFFNTPARRKFLRTVNTEQVRCLAALESLAMAHPAVGFAAHVDGRAVLECPANQSPRERALELLGKELTGEVLEVHADSFDDSRGVAMWGLVGRPSIARATNKSQHIFVNGRAIRDKSIQHAIGEAFRGLIEPSRYPTAVLMLELSPAGVDVNVHPAKAEVRFRDSGLIHTVVLRAIRDALRAADLTPTVFSLRPQAAPDPYLPGPGAAPSGPQAFVDFFKRPLPAREQEPLSYDALKESLAESTTDRREAYTTEKGYGAQRAMQPPQPASRVMQIHKSYLVTEDEQGVVIIDQHALHERAMFEYLLARIGDTSTGGLESQRLLTPVVVSATPAQIDKLATLKPLTDRIGIACDPLSPTSIGVAAFPTFLFDRNVDPVEFMTDLLAKAESAAFSPDSEEALRDVLDMMACKAAVKAGDRMSEPELADLVKLRDAVERSSNCPHGRPTSIRLTIRELERLFGRG